MVLPIYNPSAIPEEEEDYRRIKTELENRGELTNARKRAQLRSAYITSRRAFENKPRELEIHLHNGKWHRMGYFNHLLRVSAQDAINVGTLEEVLATFHHDDPEEGKGTISGLKSRYGDKVSSYVSLCTHPKLIGLKRANLAETIHDLAYRITGNKWHAIFTSKALKMFPQTVLGKRSQWVFPFESGYEKLEEDAYRHYKKGYWWLNAQRNYLTHAVLKIEAEKDPETAARAFRIKYFDVVDDLNSLIVSYSEGRLSTKEMIKRVGKFYSFKDLHDSMKNNVKVREVLGDFDWERYSKLLEFYMQNVKGEYNFQNIAKKGYLRTYAYRVIPNHILRQIDFLKPTTPVKVTGEIANAMRRSMVHTAETTRKTIGIFKKKGKK
jgi:hypothetical protein